MKIISADTIRGRLMLDGDLRTGHHDESFIMDCDDDLGFYQQGCEFLLKERDKQHDQSMQRIRESCGVG